MKKSNNNAKKDSSVARLDKGEVTYMALKLLLGGSFIALSFMAPGLPGILKMVDKNPHKAIDKLDRALRRLVLQGKVEQTGSRRHKKYRITKQGVTIAKLYEFQHYRLPTPQKKWDGKWRVICFDIPNDLRRTRVVIKGKLNALGFYTLQQSVCVYPHQCDALLAVLNENLQVQPYVRLMTVEHMNNERDLLTFFGLSRK